MHQQQEVERRKQVSSKASSKEVKAICVLILSASSSCTSSRSKQVTNRFWCFRELYFFTLKPSKVQNRVKPTNEVTLSKSDSLLLPYHSFRELYLFTPSFADESAGAEALGKRASARRNADVCRRMLTRAGGGRTGSAEALGKRASARRNES
jgi:hypothetical protein